MAGELPRDAPQTYFLLNGRPLGTIKRDGPWFSGFFTPPGGFNEFEVRFEDTRARLNFVYGVKAYGQSPYNYHEPLLKGECTGCHDDESPGAARSEADTCHRCHPARNALYPVVHGPVAAGKCLVCHDPHGSNLPNLTRENPRVMCTSCHDQPSTTAHVVDGRSKMCTLCHSPHYGLKRYLLRGDF